MRGKKHEGLSEIELINKNIIEKAKKENKKVYVKDYIQNEDYGYTPILYLGDFIPITTKDIEYINNDFYYEICCNGKLHYIKKFGQTGMTKDIILWYLDEGNITLYKKVG